MARKTVKKPVQTRAVNLESIHKIFAAVFVILGVGVVWFMKAVRYPWTITHQTNDALLGQNKTAFVTASHHIWDIPLWFGLLIILFIAVAYCVLVVSSMKETYQKSLRNKVNPLRWIYWGIISALMLEVVAMLSGVEDVVALKLLAGFTVLAGILCWLAEKDNKGTRKVRWTNLILAAIALVIPWIYILVSAIGTLAFGMVRSSWYVYVAYLILLVSNLLWFRHQVRIYKQTAKQTDYTATERSFVVLQNVTLALLVIDLIVGLHK
ncbi:MAG: hypothetical protein JWS12_156 [Candidatus Saccharibacteria bacterium]|nr:hypothetical protein [Candidatus Saccharibacteria bacterium]